MGLAVGFAASRYGESGRQIQSSRKQAIAEPCSGKPHIGPAETFAAAYFLTDLGEEGAKVTAVSSSPARSIRTASAPLSHIVPSTAAGAIVE